MNKKLILRGGVAATICMSLAGCFGSDNGGGAAAGGGNPPGGQTAYASALSAIQGMGPQTIRQTGTANYVGQTELKTLDPVSGDETGFIIGDIDLDANFDNETISGTADNFAGEVGGEAVTLDGTLTTGASNGPNVVAQTDVTVPIVGGTITSGSMIASLHGTLTESINNESSDVELNLQGTFRGNDAEAVSGGAVALIGDDDAVGFGFGGAGTFYLERQ